MNAQAFAPKLRYYQEAAVDALFDFYSQPRAHDEKGQPVKKNALVCLPTGTGKSLVIAEFVRRALFSFPGTRVMMATHVKELVKQNAAKMQEAWPLAPLGVYSAGLNSRDAIQPIIFGGVQSCVGKGVFGYRDFLIIDEAHLVSPDADTSYLKFINELKQDNPYLKVIGLTATPYRLGLGSMTNGQIFTEVVYNLCDMEGFNRLIAEGFLAPLIPKRTQTQLDVSNVGMSKGEFAQGELQAAVDKDEITYSALREIVEHGHDRRCWMVFASGVEHAEHITQMLNAAFGVPTVCLHSRRKGKENDEALRAWKAGEVRCAVSMNQLTTGVDNPMVDLIGMLRPTMSTGLWVQMLGRGTRPAPGKDNCLVLDFAGNTRRLGPINDPVIPRPKGQGAPGEAPVRICPACGCYNHASARVCLVCGTEFAFDPKLSRTAGTDELIRSDLPQIETFKVQRVVMTPHIGKASGAASIKVAYYCEMMRTFYEYVSVESPANAFRKRSRDWFRQRYHYSTPVHLRVRTGQGKDGQPDDVPATNADVIALSPEFRVPKTIKVWVNRKNPEIMGADF